MPVSDVIEREIVLRSSRSEVWTALTTEDGLAGWWADRVEVDARPGGTMRFHFGDEHGVYEAEIDHFEPEARFAYFWRPFADLEESTDYPDLRTRVEFVLAEHPDGTLLKLRETGFAALPDALAARSLADNEDGWNVELGHLTTYLETGVPVVHG